MTFEELVARNQADKRALDLIESYRNYIRSYDEIRANLPDTDECSKEDFIDMLDKQRKAFKTLWVSCADEMERPNMSIDVWLEFVKVRSEARWTR